MTFFLIFAQNIDCGYTLKQAVLTSTRNLYLRAKIRKKNTPVNPSFTIYIKVGCKGCSFHRHVCMLKIVLRSFINLLFLSDFFRCNMRVTEPVVLIIDCPVESLFTGPTLLVMGIEGGLRDGSGESASKIGEFINNLKFLSIHSDGWLAVRLSRCLLVYYLSLFFANCELKVVTCF